MTRKIAMWSGPRNISTAMMRSFENRADCCVVDEPFYAYYLQQTKTPHPMFNEIINSQSTEYDTVVNQLLDTKEQYAQDTPLQYQKHMSQHMLPGCDLSWIHSLEHCFLIRDPADVVNSYTNSRGQCSVDDIGIIRQFELFENISAQSKKTIPVIDTSLVLNNPEHILRLLCDALSISFDERMLAWPTGRRESDGVWASHWYHSVEASTGFGSPKKAEYTLNDDQKAVVEEVRPYYEKLKKNALK